MKKKKNYEFILCILLLSKYLIKSIEEKNILKERKEKKRKEIENSKNRLCELWNGKKAEKYNGFDIVHNVYKFDCFHSV